VNEYNTSGPVPQELVLFVAPRVEPVMVVVVPDALSAIAVGVAQRSFGGALQTPAVQFEPVAQRLPQPPQAVMLVAVSVHVPVQLVHVVRHP
jgi:hypothetical protein